MARGDAVLWQGPALADVIANILHSRTEPSGWSVTARQRGAAKSPGNSARTPDR
jgi:hypothetical protein